MTTHQYHKGQGLNEYALTGGLVVIACIFSLSALGTNISDMLSGTISKRDTTLASSSNISHTTNGGVMAPSIRNQTSSDSAFGRTLTVQLPNGETQQFRIPDPRTIIDTDGTDGVTKAYLAQLDQLIQAFKKVMPENDPRIAALERLSLKGHEVADAQREIEFNNNDKKFADTSSLKLMTYVGNSKEQIFDFKGFDQCSNFRSGGSAPYDHMGIVPSQCTQSLSSIRKVLQTDAQRSLLQNFSVMAADIRRDLKDQEKSGLLPLFDYFAGNIIQSAVATEKTALNNPDKSALPKQSFKNDPDKMAAHLNRKNNFKSAFIEVQANGLCGMSGFDTCQRQNGQTVQTNTSPSLIENTGINPVNATSAGSSAGSSDLRARKL
jgi:hypothetical protein